jgi:hypothetical protein
MTWGIHGPPSLTWETNRCEGWGCRAGKKVNSYSLPAPDLHRGSGCLETGTESWLTKLPNTPRETAMPESPITLGTRVREKRQEGCGLSPQGSQAIGRKNITAQCSVRGIHEHKWNRPLGWGSGCHTGVHRTWRSAWNFLQGPQGLGSPIHPNFNLSHCSGLSVGYYWRRFEGQILLCLVLRSKTRSPGLQTAAWTGGVWPITYFGK